MGFGMVFFCLRGEVEAEGVFADGSYIPAHQHASGARRGEETGVGNSRAGRTTKIHVFTNENGSPIDFEVTGGQVHDSKVAGTLIEMANKQLSPSEKDPIIFCADKAHDSQKIRAQAKANNLLPMIPVKVNAKDPNINFDREIYKLRHVVENFFARIKHYRGVSTRFEKLTRNFRSTLRLACILVFLGGKLK